MITKHFYKISFFCLLLASGLVFGQADTPWVKTKESQGILTFQRPGSSGLLQVKGVTVVEAGIDIMGGIFRDIPRHYKWVGYCKEARILEIVDSSRYVFYEVMAPPWPVSRRDMEMVSVATYYNDVMKVSIDSMPSTQNRVPVTDTYIRLKEIRAKINFEYVSATRTGISYELKINPAGDIPPFIANIFNQAYIFENMQNLKKVAVDKEYTETIKNGEDTALFARLLANPETLKNTLRDRLGRYLRSKENIAWLAADARFAGQWGANKYGLADSLFLGNYDEKLRQKALKTIIKVYLERFPLTESQRDRLLASPEVAGIFTDGKIETGLSALPMMKEFISGRGP